MQLEKKHALYGATIGLFLLSISWYYLLWNSSIWESLTLVIPEGAQLIDLGLAGLLFAIVFGITGAMCQYFEKMEVHIYGKAGVLLGVITGAIIFGISIEGIVLAVALLLGFIVMVEYTFIKKDELKKHVVYRSVAGAAHTAFFVIGLSLFFVGLFSGMSNAEQNLEKFDNALLNVSVQDDTLKAISERDAQLILDSKLQTIDDVSESNDFLRIINVESENSDALLGFVSEYRNVLLNPSTKEKLSNQIFEERKKSQSAVSIQEIAETSPMLGFLRENFWIFYGLSAMLSFFFISGILAFIVTATAKVIDVVYEKVF